MIAYEQNLSCDLPWALQEGSMHFNQGSSVHKALEKVTRKLTEMGVPYAVVGGMALFFHGYRRFTDDVDLLVTPATLQPIHDELEERGYLPPFPGSKHLRDTEHGVKVEFLTTGDYPGDGKPKPIAFPDPATTSVEVAGMQLLALPRLIELKIASGMTNVGRRKDLADVQETVRALDLPREFGDQLHPFVQDMYRQLWDEVRNNPS